jgi:hypothetical protein
VHLRSSEQEIDESLRAILTARVSFELMCCYWPHVSQILRTTERSARKSALAEGSCVVLKSIQSFLTPFGASHHEAPEQIIKARAGSGCRANLLDMRIVKSHI